MIYGGIFIGTSNIARFDVKSIFKNMFKRYTRICIHCSLNWPGSVELELGRYSFTQDILARFSEHLVM